MKNMLLSSLGSSCSRLPTDVNLWYLISSSVYCKKMMNEKIDSKIRNWNFTTRLRGIFWAIEVDKPRFRDSSRKIPDYIIIMCHHEIESKENHFTSVVDLIRVDKDTTWDVSCSERKFRVNFNSEFLWLWTKLFRFNVVLIYGMFSLITFSEFIAVCSPHATYFLSRCKPCFVISITNEREAKGFTK